MNDLNNYLKDLTAYNTWANMKILKFVEEAGEEKSVLPQQSSFPSIRKTVLHIWDAQSIWFNRIHGVSPQVWPPVPFEGNTMMACQGLLESSREFEALVGKFKTEDIHKSITYQTLKGDEFQNTIFQIIVHLMNHSTFHRGQLITMFRGAGFAEFSATDMIAYFRESKG